MFDPLPMSLGTMYCYQPLVINTDGPAVPQLDEMESLGYVIVIMSFFFIFLSRYFTHIGELEAHHSGSGFVPAYACQRALQDAFSCLLLQP